MGVVSSIFDCVFTLDSLHVQTLMLNDVQAPFLGNPLVALKATGPPLPRGGGG